VRVLGARDTTQKFLFRLADGNLIESVLIPASPASRDGGRGRSDRRTICVSTQVGCAYGCKFCASGLEGFTRNLRANEIVNQITAIDQESGEKIDNVVFMGMGEPLANFENVGACDSDYQRTVGPRDRRATHYGLYEWTRATNSQAGRGTFANSARCFSARCH
jgi:adenine C2-methylase RlmN of 23S rRNA A2503 and tRNA A37